MSAPYPNDQGLPAGAIPVRLVLADGSAFYTAEGTSPPPYTPTPLGYQQITNLTSATALTVPATATYAIIQAESVDVRWRDDGTNPTASVGMLLFAGASQTFSGDLTTLKFIQTQASSILNVSYYK